MVWATVILALALSLAALYWVVRPLFDRAPAPVLVEDDRLTDLLGRKDAVMAAIKDLEFDHKVGKLSEEDYRRYDQRLRRQAIGLIQQIEQVAPQSTSLDAALEAEIAHRRKVQAERPVPAAPAPSPAAAPVAAPVAAASPAHPEAPPLAPARSAAGNGAPALAAGVRFCTHCGGRLEPQHRFCAQCGTPVEQPAAPVGSPP